MSKYKPIFNTSMRLKEYMSKNNLKQVDILNKAQPYCKQYNVKLTKQDLSQYVAGKTKPAQNKLYILGLALNVNEAWLMGFDVPMEKGKTNTDELVTMIDSLNDSQKKNVIDYIQFLKSQSKKD